MDVLSDVLRVIRLTGAVFFTARFSSPWALASPPSTDLTPTLGKRADCLSLFHVLIEGQCWFSLDDHRPVQVETGSIVVIPHGDAHVMGTHATGQPVAISSILPPSIPGEVPHVDYGGGGESAHFVCGYLKSDQRFNPLMRALPKLLVVRADRDLPASGPEVAATADSSVGTVSSDNWLELAMQRAIDEADARRPGGSAMLSRLTELLFLEVLRRHMAELPDERNGWLAGVKNPEVGRALQLLHEHPARKWTTEDLGRAVGLSRSAMAQHFTRLVGEPPMRYLASWRMQLAQNYLRQPTFSIAAVANKVGYESDVAFHRAFKRWVGVPPAAWRQLNV